MPQAYLIGMAAAGAKVNEPSFAAFDNVMAEVTPPAPPNAPGGLQATAPDNSTIQLTWQNNATNQTGVKVEASTDNVLFYEITDLDAGATSFVNTGLKDLTQTYRVRAYNTGGYSPYSNAAGVAKPLEAASP